MKSIHNIHKISARRARIINIQAIIFFAFIVLVSCRGKDNETVSVRFGSYMDTFAAIDTSAAKTRLTHEEEWVLWETGDHIDVIEEGSQSQNCKLVEGAGTLVAVFEGRFTTGAMNRYAFHPAGMEPSLTNPSSPTISLPHSQPYRQDQYYDYSFSSNVIPMISYDNRDLEDVNFHFHPVCGILRLQFFKHTDPEVVLTSIEIESKDYPISGPFTIHGMTDPEPYITSTSTNPNDKKLTITGISDNRDIAIGGSSRDSLRTFYVPLPATQDVTDGSSGNADSRTYKLRVTVKGRRNGTPVQCQNVLQARIHRCNVTMMRALDLTQFSETTAGSSEVCLVGCGTHDRPFQIYSADDLNMVREAFASGSPKVNGQAVKGIGEVGGPTYFKIVRSDISLVTSAQYAAMNAAAQKKAVVWTEGIRDFKGVMYFATSAATLGGINNSSGAPLFHSIATNGMADGIFLKDSMLNISPETDIFSPLCHTNNGIIKDCHNLCKVSISSMSSSSKYLAGLCAINNGQIVGGANDAALITTTNVAGICYRNNGTVKGSFSLSRALPKGANIAGICFENHNQVLDCLASSSVNPVNSTGNWGVVVFNNTATAVISNCRSAGSLVYTTTGSIGGICHTNHGIVRNCSNTVTLQGGHGSIGGIVAEQWGGEIYNCESNGDNSILGTVGGNVADNAGGLVGWLHGGYLRNSFSTIPVTSAINAGSVVGRVELEHYTTTPRPVENCWSSYNRHFKGHTDTIMKVGTNCFSAYTEDGDTLYGCYVIDEDYQVTDYTRSNASLWRFTYSSISTIASVANDGIHPWPGSNASEKYLAGYLNCWVYYMVNNEHEAPGKYWYWLKNSQGKPYFDNPNETKTKTKTKTKRKRKRYSLKYD